MIRRLRFFTGVKGCVSFRTRLLHGSLRLGMIGELAARRRGNQVHVIPVSPGVDCGSRALTPLLSTRFGGRKLITDAPWFGMTGQLQATCVMLWTGNRWYAATAAAWQRSCLLD